MTRDRIVVRVMVDMSVTSGMSVMVVSSVVGAAIDVSATLMLPARFLLLYVNAGRTNF